MGLVKRLERMFNQTEKPKLGRKPKPQAYQVRRRIILYADVANTVRVSEGFDTETGLPRYWLEFWCGPSEYTGYHWRYNNRTSNEHIMQAWVNHYALLPIAGVSNLGYLTTRAVDQG